MKLTERFTEVMAAIKDPAKPPVPWYTRPEAPDDGEWWWAVEHSGHPAFYLRALISGDFAPGRGGPNPRHVRALRGGGPKRAAPRCGTCNAVPDVGDLEPIERRTGVRGFLDEFRTGRVHWPAPTEQVSCWLCSARGVPADHSARVGELVVNVCKQCAVHMAWVRKKR